MVWRKLDEIFYLLLAEFNICSASYQLSFSRSDLWPKREMHKSGLSHFLSH